MAIQDIQQEMMKYFMQLGEKEQKSILKLIKKFLNDKNRPSDFFVDLEKYSKAKYNKEIDEAMSRIDSGKFITQEELEKEAERW